MEKQPIRSGFSRNRPAGTFEEPPTMKQKILQCLKDLTSHPMDLSVFLEPRGFMRFLQLSFAVFAYAAIKGYEGFVLVTYCGNQTAKLTFSYPFKLSDSKFSVDKSCNNTKLTQDISLEGDFSIDSTLFVFVCWLAFLYCLIIIYVYVKLTPYYESNVKWPITDFLVSLTISGFWILFFVYWANAVSGIKEATSGSIVKADCNRDAKGKLCDSVIPSPYFGLNVSIALGLVNLILWTSNQWFLFKETPWFGGAGPVAGFRSARPSQQI